MSRIVLLGGGMGQELIRRSSNPPSPLWSARVLMDEPEIVEAVHRDYVAAGAKVLTLNCYSATPERLARDASEDLFEPLQARVIEIAQRVVEGEVTIGGCIPPLFGSYKPETAPEYEICLDIYRRVVAQQRDAIDVFICETLSSVKEIEATVTAAVESGKPVWCGMSVLDEDGTRLRSGELLSDSAGCKRGRCHRRHGQLFLAGSGRRGHAHTCRSGSAVLAASPMVLPRSMPWKWAVRLMD